MELDIGVRRRLIAMLTAAITDMREGSGETPLLDLLGSEAWHLRRHLDRNRAEQRVGVDRQLRPRIDAENAGKDRNQPHDKSFSETKCDELVNH